MGPRNYYQWAANIIKKRQLDNIKLLMKYTILPVVAILQDDP